MCHIIYHSNSKYLNKKFEKIHDTEKKTCQKTWEIGRDKWLNVTVFCCMNIKKFSKNLTNTRKPTLNL